MWADLGIGDGIEFDAITQLTLGFAAIGTAAKVASVAREFKFTSSLSSASGRPLKFHLGVRHKPSNIMVRFERGYRSPLYKGLSDKSIITTHFNIAKPGAFNYHVHLNPVKWKYFY